jgi:hypothetical protein
MYSTRVGSGLSVKYEVFEKARTDNHPSLFVLAVSEAEKMFIILTPDEPFT